MRCRTFGLLFFAGAFAWATPARADIAGIGFRDLDGDGVDDGVVETGVGGIEVRAFDSASNTPVDSGITAADGAYTLTLGAGRLQG